MNKRKIFTLALAIAMIAILAIGGTLAYFVDTDEATNVFTVGNVSIHQDEWQRDEETGEIEEFEQNQNVFPAVHDKLTPKEDVTVDGYDFTIRSQDGNYIDKIVNVTNDGTNDAYIRTIIAVPNMNGYDDASPAKNPLHWNYLDASDFDGIGWDWNGSSDDEVTEQLDKVAAVEIGGVEYDLYVATYNEAVAAGETTSPSMVGFYLDQSVGCDDTGYFFMNGNDKTYLAPWMTADEETGIVTLKILVASQACQTEGFADAWEALDECFGDITATNHPWAE